MLTLSFDTSTKVLSVALLDDDRLLDRLTSDEEIRHSERLMPAIDLLLKRNNKTIDGVSLVVAGKGPGSYTGIRIALSTALGLSSHPNTDVMTGSSLEALAGETKDQLTYPVIDARGGRLFAGGYENDRQVFPDCQTTADLLADHLIRTYKSKHKPIVLAGDGGVLLANRLAEKTSNLDIVVEAKRWPDAFTLARMALARYKARGRGLCQAQVRPFYAAQTQAERLAKRT